MSSDVPPAPKAVIAEGVMPLPASAPAVPAAPAPEPPAESAALPVESLLLRFRMITPAQLADAMKEEAVSGNSVASIVVEKGWVTAEAMAQIVPSPAEPAAAPAPEPVPAPAEPPPAAAAAPVVEAPAVEAPVLEAPAPPLAPEPVAPPMPEPVAQQPIAQPEAYVAAAPPVPLVAEPEPVQELPAPVAAPMPEPVSLPQPVFTPEPEPAAASQPEVVFQVVACLTNGERVEIARVHDATEAKSAATDAMRSLEDDGDWPCFSGRFIRPETVISIDVAAHL